MRSRCGPIAATGAPGTSRCCCPARWSAWRQPGCSRPSSRRPMSSSRSAQPASASCSTCFLAHVPAQPRRSSAASGMFWGLLAGFTSTIIQVGGPPYQAHILPQRLDKLTLIGTTIIFFALVNLMKIAPYAALGQFSTRTLATSLVLLPLAIASNLFGLWLARRTPTELFYRLAYLLVLLISLVLFWRGTSAIFFT